METTSPTTGWAFTTSRMPASPFDLVHRRKPRRWPSPAAQGSQRAGSRTGPLRYGWDRDGDDLVENPTEQAAVPDHQ